MKKKTYSIILETTAIKRLFNFSFFCPLFFLLVSCNHSTHIKNDRESLSSSLDVDCFKDLDSCATICSDTVFYYIRNRTHHGYLPLYYVGDTLWHSISKENYIDLFDIQVPILKCSDIVIVGQNKFANRIPCSGYYRIVNNLLSLREFQATGITLDSLFSFSVNIKLLNSP